MKYIRTKDGRILKNGVVERKFGIKRGKGYEILVNDINKLREADTIPELCDGFIITSKQGHIYDSYGDYNYELKEVLPQAREECPDEDWDLYGCILVNGIIKQVAKLNDDKGELELL